MRVPSIISKQLYHARRLSSSLAASPCDTTARFASIRWGYSHSDRHLASSKRRAGATQASTGWAYGVVYMHTAARKTSPSLVARAASSASSASSASDSLPDIDKLAELAQLPLTDDEKKEIGPQINGIIEWMGQLNNDDVDGVRPSMRGGDVGTGRHEDVAWLRKDAAADDPEDVDGRKGVLERTNGEGFVPVAKGVFR